jgi:vacuolar-type H+-ATPase subunit F/Vma7
VALGEEAAVAGFALAGVRVVAASRPEQVWRAWAELSGAAVVILTAAAAEALGDERFGPAAPLTVVMPA